MYICQSVPLFRSEERTYESVAGSVLRQHQHLEGSMEVIQNISYSAVGASPAEATPVQETNIKV